VKYANLGRVIGRRKLVLFEWGLVDVFSRERPAIEVCYRLAVLFERPAFPLTLSPEELERIGVEVIDHIREGVEVVVPGYHDDWNPRFVELCNPVFERAIRLEIAILLINNITSNHDRIDIPVDCFLDRRQPDSFRRQLGTIQIIRDPTRVTAEVKISRAK
jgi:hypothetical protein